MKHRITLLILGAALSLHAQQDELTKTLQLTTAIGPTGYTCGEYYPPTIFCPGIPIRLPNGSLGSLYVDTGLGTSPALHSIQINGLDLGPGTITSSAVDNDKGVLTIAFNGATTDGDGDTYTGTGTFTGYSYEKSSGGGRGSHNTILVLACTGGTMTITYSQHHSGR